MDNSESYGIIDFFMASLDKILEFTAPNECAFIPTEDLALLHKRIYPDYWEDYE